LWLVDFDNGSAYDWWRWPEEEFAYFHSEDDGFDCRQPPRRPIFRDGPRRYPEWGAAGTNREAS
jgi:hypothetical protein